SVTHEQSASGSHVKAMTSRRDKTCARQSAVRVESNGLVFPQKIVVGITIDQGGDLRDDETFFAIGDVNIGVEQWDFLFFVLGQPRAPRSQRKRARQSDARRVLRVDARALA